VDDAFAVLPLEAAAVHRLGEVAAELLFFALPLELVLCSSVDVGVVPVGETLVLRAQGVTRLTGRVQAVIETRLRVGEALLSLVGGEGAPVGHDARPDPATCARS
jgi:hypothetical protein